MRLTEAWTDEGSYFRGRARYMCAWKRKMNHYTELSLFSTVDWTVALNNHDKCMQETLFFLQMHAGKIVGWSYDKKTNHIFCSLQAICKKPMMITATYFAG